MWVFSSPGLYPAAKKIHLKLIPNIPAAAAKTRFILVQKAHQPRGQLWVLNNGRGLRSFRTKSALVLVLMLTLALAAAR